MDDVCLLVVEGFADWEPAHAVAEIRRSGRFDVRTVGFTAAPVLSMGGLRVVPDNVLSHVLPHDVRLLILPGSDLWEDEDHYPRAELESVLRAIHTAGRPIAAICGATLAVARAGLLDDRRHTSNASDYLASMVPGYRGASRYESRLAVRDRGIITASGLAPVDFAREIFAELDLFSASDAALWFDMFKHGRLPGEDNIVPTSRHRDRF